MTAPRPRILAVDDNLPNLVALGNALAAEFDLQVATSGQSALALAAKTPPDLILLDVMMPEMDGYEVCRRLKADTRLATVPVVFVTALADIESEATGLKLGAADYITKPINVGIARQRIRNLLEREALRKEIEASRYLLEARVAERTQALLFAKEAAEATSRELQKARDAMALEIEQRQRTQAALEAEREEQRHLIAKLEDAHCQLLQSEKLASLGQLAAGVAHEINNPIGFVNSNLNTLKSYIADLLQVITSFESLIPAVEADPNLRQRMCQLLKQGDVDYLRQDIGDLLEETLDGTTRVRTIVQGLRDFSRAGGETWVLANVHAGLDSTLNVVRNEIKYKAEVHLEYGDIPEIECLPAQLNQVFLNLLVNAAQAIAERGHITIRTGHKDGWVAVTITDTGCGMSEETRKKIFDPFFTTKPVGQGTGLGLSVSYGIIKKHGGHINVDSTPGVGTTFTVLLPVKHVAE